MNAASRTRLEQKIYAIETEIQSIVTAASREECWVMHYGAVEIDPKYLTCTICVKTDAEKQRLQADPALRQTLFELLEKHRYPKKARADVIIKFDAQESMDREANGNAWHHWR